MGGLSWMFIAIGVVVGISITAALILRLGLSFTRKANLEDRGEWDRPLTRTFGQRHSRCCL